jgi:hypothetical protein
VSGMQKTPPFCTVWQLLSVENSKLGPDEDNFFKELV